MENMDKGLTVPKYVVRDLMNKAHLLRMQHNKNTRIMFYKQRL